MSRTPAPPQQPQAGPEGYQPPPPGYQNGYPMAPPQQPQAGPEGYRPPPPGYQNGYPMAPLQQPIKKKHLFRWILLGLVGFIVVIAVASSLSGTSSKPAVGPSTSATTTNSGVASPGVSKGVGAKDASGDITLPTTISDDGFSKTASISITNHSSKRSDYFVTVAVTSADGATQFDTAMVSVQGLEPGQTSIEDAMFLKNFNASQAKISLQSVQRTAAN